MHVYDLVVKSRSYRSYSSDRAVTKEELTVLVECARLCPSAVNKQFLKYRLCAGKAEMASLLPHIKWAAALPDIHLPPVGHEPPAAIVLCHDHTIAQSENASTWDAGITAQTILLAATEMGLGGCMIGNFVKATLKEALALPAHLTPILVVAIGKPDEEIILETAPCGTNTIYYRDANGVHHVPKRAIEDILV